MKKSKVIKSHNLPARLPILATVVGWIALEHWHASQLAWGITGTLFALLWVVAIFAICLQEKVDIFETKKP
jgi:hypothetical protein